MFMQLSDTIGYESFRRRVIGRQQRPSRLGCSCLPSRLWDTAGLSALPTQLGACRRTDFTQGPPHRWAFPHRAHRRNCVDLHRACSALAAIDRLVDRGRNPRCSLRCLSNGQRRQTPLTSPRSAGSRCRCGLYPAARSARFHPLAPSSRVATGPFSQATARCHCLGFEQPGETTRRVSGVQ